MNWAPQRGVVFRWRAMRKNITWTVIILVILGCLYVNRPLRYTPKGVNLNKLNKYSYSEKYEGKALSEVPLAERLFETDIDPVFENGCRDPFLESEKQRANAAFVVLARNSEIDGVILSMRSLERHFNQWFNYPWIFLNDEPFDKEFKQRVLEVASGKAKFGLIPGSKWKFPNNDTPKFKEAIESQGDRSIMYGNMASYHSMCRFYSGYFFEHPMVKKLDWYWRVEPDVDFYCDLTYDPFLEMEKNGKKYGYTIAIKELVNTVPSLFRRTQQFIKEYQIDLPDSWNFFINNYKFFKGEQQDHYQDVKSVDDLITKIEQRTPLNLAIHYLEHLESTKKNNNDNDNDNDDEIFDLKYFDKELINVLVTQSTKRGLNKAINEIYNGEEYNLCHFWSNFEIASNSLFTSPEYKAYYDFLEQSGGFYEERWGDAPIHSLAAGMFLNLDEIHYFRDIGYKHSTLAHCPFNSPNQLPYKAGPNFKHQFLPEDEIYYSHPDPPIPQGSGCRCRCPSDHEEIENSGGSCSNKWAMLTSSELFELKNKPKSRNEFGGIPKDEQSILGVDQFLNLDKMEQLAEEWLYESIQKGKNIKKWNFSKQQRKILEGLII